MQRGELRTRKQKHLLESEDSCTNNPETNFCRDYFLAFVDQSIVSTKERLEQSEQPTAVFRFFFLIS